MQASGTTVTQKKRPEESMLASATADTVARVGIVLSSFKGSTEHDGTPLPGLADPKPVDADLTPAQWDALLAKAMELGSRRRAPRGGSRLAGASDDWVVVLITLTPDIATDPPLVRALVDLLAGQRRCRRLTIAAGAPPTPAWSELVDASRRRFPNIQIEFTDLGADAYLQVPATRRTFAAKNPDGVYAVPKTIRECDRIYSVAPLQTSPLTGVSLTVGNYWWIAPPAVYGPDRRKLLDLGSPVDVLTDLYLHHPPAYAIAGGATHRDAGGTLRHNLLVAGSNAVSVDAVAAEIMGFDPRSMELFDKLELRGFGVRDPDSIWTRGNEIEEAHRPFRKPAGWEKS